MKRLGIISAALASLMGAAIAADLPVKAPSAQPAPPAFLPFTWTGAYAGASGGFGWTTSGGLDATGGFGGGQIGYNFQTGSLVFGIEGNISGADISQTVPGITVQGMPFTTSFTNDTLASLQGRVGLAYNSWLFYGTFGAGWAHEKISSNIAGPPFSGSQWLTGWTTGAGVEWAIAPNWSTKFEYQHWGGLGTAPNPFGTVPAGKVDIDTLKIGINYLFR